MLQRWTLSDGTTTYTVPRNPNTMTFPAVRKTFDSLPIMADGRTAVRMAPQGPVEVSFGGSLVDQTHHDDLLTWVAKEVPVTITDHLSRTWIVLMIGFELQSRRHGRPGTSWYRGTYTIKASLL